MKRITRAVAAVAGAGALLFTASPAYAWDCIRVSGSLKGLQQSTKSGNWEFATFAEVVDGAVQYGDATAEEGACVLAAWREAGLPEYFAIGIGVGGARGAMQSGHISEEDFYVIAKNAPMKNLTDGKGIDHLFPTIMSVGGHCFEGEPPPDEH